MPKSQPFYPSDLMMATEPSSSDKHQQALLNHGIDDKSRRHTRWTREETLSLIQAKDITENNTPNRGRRISSALVGSISENMEPKWVSISAYCQQHRVNRGPAQCRKRWSNLIGDFKKVKAWESKLTDKADSFWLMRNDLRKERKLPVSFDREVFKVLVGREMDLGLGFVVSPLPLQAVASSGGLVCDDISDYDGDDGEGDVNEEIKEEVDIESDKKNDCKQFVEVEDIVSSDLQGEMEEDNKRASNNVTESPVKSERILEQHNQAFQNQNGCSNQDPATGAFGESWLGISHWDSQEGGKRQRMSRDGDEVSDMEALIIRLMETNNKMLNAQLDVLNKNRQLDREQKKENNDALVAVLDKLTNALVKIAEKL